MVIALPSSTPTSVPSVSIALTKAIGTVALSLASHAMPINMSMVQECVNSAASLILIVISVILQYVSDAYILMC
jgi:hypothetical protein